MSVLLCPIKTLEVYIANGPERRVSVGWTIYGRTGLRDAVWSIQFSLRPSSPSLKPSLNTEQDRLATRRSCSPVDIPQMDRWSDEPQFKSHSSPTRKIHLLPPELRCNGLTQRARYTSRGDRRRFDQFDPVRRARRCPGLDAAHSRSQRQYFWIEPQLFVLHSLAGV